MLEHKAIKADISGEGTVDAVFSTFDIVDRDGDIVVRDALQPYHGKELPMVASHDWSLRGWLGSGRIEVTEKDARFHGNFLMDTADGREAFAKVKALQGLTQWSWGFSTVDSSFETRDEKNVRVIKRVEPYEVSPVLVGANPKTRTLAVKTMLDKMAGIEEETAENLDELLEKYASALAELKVGARLSASSRSRLEEVMNTLRALLEGEDNEEEEEPKEEESESEEGEKAAEILPSIAALVERHKYLQDRYSAI